MKNKTLNIINIFLLFALAVTLILLSVFSTVYSIAHAETSEEVLQDLRRDKNFNEEDYPYVKDNYALYVIQIGESSNKELFVYVYLASHLNVEVANLSRDGAVYLCIRPARVAAEKDDGEPRGEYYDAEYEEKSAHDDT